VIAQKSEIVMRDNDNNNNHHIFQKKKKKIGVLRGIWVGSCVDKVCCGLVSGFAMGYAMFGTRKLNGL